MNQESRTEGLSVPVGQQASVPTKTVTHFSEGKVELPKPKRARKKAAPKITTNKIDPRVLKEAMKLAKGDASKLMIDYEDQSIVVRNNPRK